ncbi:MAG: relaxase/mobilization nuclease domain-containing protein [Candidatus Pedobacter colombiensis]|uniref:Relaxase/mobilization nuclease domain-containing protein n=1 Tax=Candidatus Pedobacter colombiensis TaxID=3121371 RepID=A0AAJ6B7P5_9SPHI|nr:relaxase/mobilization nuclease domain-containing protein [Pedobacter sp.]WEK21317.1 MAG: relaxase/mobilization nuclease domain-containing protein [Pedobacter sp.]
MVAVIGSGYSIRRTFHYNENKVNKGIAECLMAANYPIDLEHTDAHERINMLLKTAALRPDVKRKSTHISLNFAPGEQLSDSRLKAIAQEYMEQIGFGAQPYLVYRHDDAAHPHIHIVTTKIKADGDLITTQYIGRDLSEPVRKSIEQKYGLVRAEDHKKLQFSLKPVDATRVFYGELPTRKAIANVLESVLQGYKYTSLAELNAVLNQYNIGASSGNEDSRIYQHKGLIYHVLNAQGEPVGVPVKASSFHNNPGLKFLQERYLKNDVHRQQHKEKVKNTIDMLLLRNPKISLEQLVQKLKTGGIHTALRQNSDGVLYGLTYVDHRTKCVFNGSALGKKYSAKGMMERLENAFNKAKEQEQKPQFLPPSKDHSAPVTDKTRHENPSMPADQGEETNNEKGLVESLMQYEYSTQNVPYEWKKKKKKRKKR